MLKDPNTQVDPVAITYLHQVGNIGISGKDWRYIRYRDDSEELYNIKLDPYEWNNLATDPQFADKLAEFRKHIPAHFAPKPQVKVADLPPLPWHPITEGTVVPPSKPDGTPFRLAFVNQLDHSVQYHLVNTEGKSIKKGNIAASEIKEIQSRPGEVWVITGKNGEQLGYFKLLDRSSKAIITK